MNRCFAVALVTAVTAVAVAQVPDKFTNLQFFPKDISRKELTNTMRGFSFSLGVRCEFCHVQGADKKLDFPNDSKPEKQKARAMLQMVAAINRDYLAKLPGGAPQTKVECVTCHRRVPKPRQIASIMSDTLDSKGLEAATTEYRELRKKTFGGGQFDFSEVPLNQLTESLLDAGKAKEAAAFMDLNAELSAPLSLWGTHLLGMAHRANGDTDKAIAAFEESIKLSPDDSWAKQQIEELKAKKRDY